MCAACVCATVTKVERDSRLTQHHWENESCDVGVATTYGQFLDDLSGFVSLKELNEHAPYKRGMARP